MTQGIRFRYRPVNVTDHNAGITAPQENTRLTRGRPLETSIDRVGNAIDSRFQIQLFQ